MSTTTTKSRNAQKQKRTCQDEDYHESVDQALPEAYRRRVERVCRLVVNFVNRKGAVSGDGARRGWGGGKGILRVRVRVRGWGRGRNGEDEIDDARLWIEIPPPLPFTGH